MILYGNDSISKILIEYQMKMIKLRKNPNIYELNDNNFKYTIEINNKWLNYLVFEYNNEFESDYLIITINMMLKKNISELECVLFIFYKLEM
jgi:hypothetical protein